MKITATLTISEIKHKFSLADDVELLIVDDEGIQEGTYVNGLWYPDTSGKWIELSIIGRHNAHLMIGGRKYEVLTESERRGMEGYVPTVYTDCGEFNFNFDTHIVAIKPL